MAASRVEGGIGATIYVQSEAMVARNVLVTGKMGNHDLFLLAPPPFMSSQETWLQGFFGVVATWKFIFSVE